MGDSGTSDPGETPNRESGETLARREFLRKCGKYAVVVPPSMVLLLASSDETKATTILQSFNPGGFFGPGGLFGPEGIDIPEPPSP